MIDDSSDDEMRTMQREWRRPQVPVASPCRVGMASQSQVAASQHQVAASQWQVAASQRQVAASQRQVAASPTPFRHAELAQLSARHQEGNPTAAVEWLQFLGEEIKQVQAIFFNKPLLINTMCSGIGAPTTALQARTAVNYIDQCPVELSNQIATLETTAHDHKLSIARSTLTGDEDPVHRDLFF